MPTLTTDDDHMPDCKCLHCARTVPIPDDHQIFEGLEPDEMPAAGYRTYYVWRWGRFMAWIGFGVLVAGTLTGCSAKQVTDAATKPTCLRGQHVVTEPARTDKAGRKHERIRYCEADSTPMQRALTDAAGYSLKNCAAIDNAENAAGWIIDGKVTLARYSDYGDNLGYNPTPAKSARPILRQTELAIQAGAAAEKFVVVCA
jgi:hypothetical protein